MDLFYNGNVFTGDSFVEAFVVDGNHFVATGRSEELLKKYSLSLIHI